MARRKAIPITQEEILSRVRYEDGKLFWLPRGYGKFDKQFAGKQAGHYRDMDGKTVIAFNQTCILIHRAIWIYHFGEIPEGMEIDHINQDCTDNRIENLRLCERHENAWNTGKRKDNKSGVKGVCWNPLTNSWRARVHVNKITIEVGSFQTLEDAEAAVKETRIKYHGQFANMGYTHEEMMQ